MHQNVWQKSLIHSLYVWNSINNHRNTAVHPSGLPQTNSNSAQRFKIHGKINRLWRKCAGNGFPWAIPTHFKNEEELCECNWCNQREMLRVQQRLVMHSSEVWPSEEQKPYTLKHCIAQHVTLVPFLKEYSTFSTSHTKSTAFVAFHKNEFLFKKICVPVRSLQWSLNWAAIFY